MQVSTTLKSPKERKSIFNQISKEYPGSETDYYLTSIGDKFNWSSKGKAVKIRTVDLAEVSKKNRLKRLESELDDDADTIKSYIENIKDEVEVSKNKLPELQNELKQIEIEISQLRGSFKNFLKKITKSKSLQITFSSLNSRKRELEENIFALNEIIEDEDQGIDAQLESYINRKELIEGALQRTATLFEIEIERIAILSKQKEKLEKRFETIQNSVIKPSDRNKSKSKMDEIKEKLYSNSTIKLFMEQRDVFQTQNLNKIELRSIRLEIKRLDEQISRMENEHNSSGRIRESYYLMENFEKGGDLVCFSRRFRGDKINIESEMSHIPRIRVDQSETLKPLYTITGLLTGLVVILIATDLMGIEFDLLNFHTFYLMVYVFQNFRYLDKMQNRDHIFDALYYSLSSSEITIQYNDEKNKLSSIKALCYHIDLLYSKKQNIYNFIQTTEADILSQSDSRLVNLNISLQKEVSLLELDIAAYQEENKTLTQQNQNLASRYEAAEKNAEANVKRTMNYRDEIKPGFWESTGTDIVKYAGSGLIIYMVLNLLDRMIPSVITVESGSSGGSLNFGTSFLLGYIAGVATILLLLRFSRSR